MATVEQVTVWCDECLSMKVAPRHVDAEEFVIRVDKRKPRRIALCDKHRVKILDPLLALLPVADTVV